jgi:hypothetical protein
LWADPPPPQPSSCAPASRKGGNQVTGAGMHQPTQVVSFSRYSSAADMPCSCSGCTRPAHLQPWPRCHQATAPTPQTRSAPCLAAAAAPWPPAGQLQPRPPPGPPAQLLPQAQQPPGAPWLLQG